MNSLQPATTPASIPKIDLVRHEPDPTLLISRVRALFSSKQVLEEYAREWEKKAPWSLKNDQVETVRTYGFTRDSIAIALNDDPQRGKFADILILLALDRNIRFRYFFDVSKMEPYYHRLF